MWPHRHPDDLSRLAWIRFLGSPDIEVMRAIAVVEELVGQNEFVVISEAVECANRIGIVGPALIARDMTLDRPGLAAIERLVEAEQMVVALRTDNPLGVADQVFGIGRINA